jgi:hypothetical protein
MTTEKTAHGVVLREWMYWLDELKKDKFSLETDASSMTRCIVASNLTIASLKFQEE